MTNIQPEAVTPRYRPTDAGGFIDTGAIYLGADGIVYVLEWSKDLGSAKFKSAQERCAALGEGWRAPTPHELVGVVNYDKELPATDAPGIESGWYWTNQVDPSSPSDRAICVCLSYGNVSWHGQDSSGRVRAVRRVRASQFLNLGL